MSKIQLIPLSISHLDNIMTWINDKESLHYFATMKKRITREEELLFIKKMIDSCTDIVYSMFLDDVYIGQCSVNNIYWPARNGRLFIYIKKEHRLKGLGPDCMNEILRIIFDILDLHKLWLIIRNNNKSKEWYKSIGFIEEGLLKDEYFVNGKFYDMVRLYMLNPK